MGTSASTRLGTAILLLVVGLFAMVEDQNARQAQVDAYNAEYADYTRRFEDWRARLLSTEAKGTRFTEPAPVAPRLPDFSGSPFSFAIGTGLLVASVQIVVEVLMVTLDRLDERRRRRRTGVGPARH